jgi:hypothetical protein
LTDVAARTLTFSGFLAVPGDRARRWLAKYSQRVRAFPPDPQRRAGRTDATAVLPQPPGPVLLWSTALLSVVALAIPFMPYASEMGFVKMPGSLIASLAAISIGYVAATELVKRWFYRPAHERRSRR